MRNLSAVRAAAALATAAPVLVLVLVLVGCTAPGSSSAAPSSSASPAASRSARGVQVVARAAGSTPAPGPGIFSRVLDNPRVTVTSAGLYVAWFRQQASGIIPPTLLARVNAATGAIEAQREFAGGVVGAPVLADGSLWVTDSTPGRDPTPDGDRVPGRELLLRLDPATLAVTGKLAVGGARYGGGDTGQPGQVAFAGGAIWMDGGGLLVRVNPASVTAELTITLPFPDNSGLAEHPSVADDSSVAASPDGTVLIVSETDQGIGTVQRRDPVAGALLASSPDPGIEAPTLAGVTDSGFWLAAATGMLGYVERLTTATLTRVRSTQLEGTNDIGVRVADGAAWITDGVGGSARNYCADPVTGRRLAALPLPDFSQDYLLAVGAGVLYYAAFDSSGNGWRIATVPVPAACA
jgi:hypothetical protein